MLFFVIDYHHPEEGWIDALWATGHRPFRAQSLREAEALFDRIPKPDQATHRYRRVEYGEFLNRGGI